MRLNISGSIDLNNVSIDGLKIADEDGMAIDVEQGVNGDDEGYVCLKLSKAICGYGHKKEICEIVLSTNGDISVIKHIWRPTHDHDDSIHYREVRGVTKNPTGRSSGELKEDTITEEPLNVLPVIVDW